MRSVQRLLGAAFIVLSASTAFAQVSALARVAGTVVDSEGKPIRAATITLTNADNGLTVTGTTDERGRFAILGLKIGQWRFVASAPGFISVSGVGTLKGGVEATTPLDLVMFPSGMLVGTLAGVQAKDVQADLATADTLFTQQRWDDAIAAYKTLLNRAPVLTSINLQIGLAYRKKGDTAAAIAAYNELLKADPDNERAKTELALTQAEAGDRKGAQAALLKLAESKTAGSNVFYQLGEMSFDDGALDDAMRWYRRAAEIDGSWGKPLYKLGMTAAKKGDSTDARNFLTQAMTVDPLSPEAALAKTAVEQLNR